METVWSFVWPLLDVSDVVSVFRTCASWKKLGTVPSLWRGLMRRDFPEHVVKSGEWSLPDKRPCTQKNDIPFERKTYQDLYQFGAYYLPVAGSIPLTPERPLCQYIRVQGWIPFGQQPDATVIRMVVTYRNKVSDFLRYPFESKLYKIFVVQLDVEKEIKLLHDESLPERAYVDGDDLYCVSSREIHWITSVASALRQPFVSDTIAIETFVQENLNPVTISVDPSATKVVVTGSLDPGVTLSTIGSDDVHTGEGTFTITPTTISVDTSDTVFTHLDDQPLATLIPPVVPPADGHDEHKTPPQVRPPEEHKTPPQVHPPADGHDDHKTPPQVRPSEEHKTPPQVRPPEEHKTPPQVRPPEDHKNPSPAETGSGHKTPPQARPNDGHK